MSKKQELSILVATDFSAAGDLAIKRALSFFPHENAHIHVLHVATKEEIDQFEGSNFIEKESKALDLLPEKVWREIGKVVNEVAIDGSKYHIWQHVRIGNPIDEISQIAIDYEVDLIICGTHNRHGIEKFLLGSVTEKVLREIPCPVMIVRENKLKSFKKSPHIEKAHKKSDPPPPDYRPHTYSPSQRWNHTAPTGMRIV